MLWRANGQSAGKIEDMKIEIEQEDFERTFRDAYRMAKLRDAQGQALGLASWLNDEAFKIHDFVSKIESLSGVQLTIGRESEISRDLSSVPSETTRQTPNQ